MAFLNDNSINALWKAFRENDCDRAKELIRDHSGNAKYLDTRDSWGFTAMHYAAERQNVELMQLLRDCGSRSLHWVSHEGRTPRSLCGDSPSIIEFIDAHPRIESSQSSCLIL